MTLPRDKIDIVYDESDHFVYVIAKDIGVMLRWDGESSLKISVSGEYEGLTKGQCSLSAQFLIILILSF